MEERIEELENTVNELLGVIEGINRTIANINTFNKNQLVINSRMREAVQSNTNSISKIADILDRVI